MSYAQFRNSEISPLTLTLLKVVHMLGLISMETGMGDKKDTIKINNLTLINFVIKCIGPCHEQTLTLYMLGLQVGNTFSPTFYLITSPFIKGAWDRDSIFHPIWTCSLFLQRSYMTALS